MVYLDHYTKKKGLTNRQAFLLQIFMFESSESQEAENKDEAKGNRESVVRCCRILDHGILEFQV